MRMHGRYGEVMMGVLRPSNCLPDPRELGPLGTSDLSALVVTPRCKHNFLLAHHAFMSSARIHHVEYFRQVCDEFGLGDRPIMIRVDLIHHFHCLKATSVASGCKGRNVVASAYGDEFFRIDNACLFLIE